MPLRCVVSAFVAAALLCVAPSAVAHPQKHHQDGAVIAPIDRIGGLTGPEALVRSLTLGYEEVPPPDFAGGCLPFLPGVVELLPPPEGGELRCTVPAGTKIVAFPFAACSDAEPEPFFGRDEAEQRACALALLEGFPSLPHSVDGGPPVDVTSEPFRLSTPQFAVDIPPDNVFNARPGPATVVGEGFGFVIRLRPGRHTIAVTPAGENAGPPFTVTVDVVRDCKPHSS